MDSDLELRPLRDEPVARAIWLINDTADDLTLQIEVGGDYAITLVVQETGEHSVSLWRGSASQSFATAEHTGYGDHWEAASWRAPPGCPDVRRWQKLQLERIWAAPWSERFRAREREAAQARKWFRGWLDELAYGQDDPQKFPFRKAEP